MMAALLMLTWILPWWVWVGLGYLILAMWLAPRS